MKRYKAAVIGATGIAGQQFLACLENHPWFEVTVLAASERSAGKTYREAITSSSGALQWFVETPPSEDFLSMKVENAASFDAAGVDVVFTAVESDAAKQLEPRFAEKKPVISTASAFRYEEDVPIFIPAVNMDHHALIPVQKKKRGWKGFITPIPNCTTTGLAITLKPLFEAFGVRSVVMTSLQALSGAGRSPGVIGLDIVDNVIPYIPKEEEKVQIETQKILGRLSGEKILPAAFPVSATCTRVPVLEAHTECVFVSLEKKAKLDAVREAWRAFGGAFAKAGYPTCPKELIAVEDDPFRPQPRRDRDRGAGMTTTVGRLREDPALENGIKYVLVSHNTKMGAARGAVLVAEYLMKQGYIR